MLKIIVFILILLFVSLSFIYVLTYGFPWNRVSSSWTLKNNEIIEEIDYGVKTGFSQESKVVATVYLTSGTSNKKLAKGDSLMVNGQVIDPEYYNSGAASGYNYSAEIPKMESYTLLIKRQKGEEIKKVVSSKYVTITFPETISKSLLFSIPYTTIETNSGFESYVNINSPTKQPILMNDKYQSGLQLSTKTENNTIVLDTDSPYTKKNNEKFTKLKTIPLTLSVGAMFEQPDGGFYLFEDREVKIVD